MLGRECEYGDDERGGGVERGVRHEDGLLLEVGVDLGVVEPAVLVDVRGVVELMAR